MITNLQLSSIRFNCIFNNKHTYCNILFVIIIYRESKSICNNIVHETKKVYYYILLTTRVFYEFQLLSADKCKKYRYYNDLSNPRIITIMCTRYWILSVHCNRHVCRIVIRADGVIKVKNLTYYGVHFYTHVHVLFNSIIYDVCTIMAYYGLR